VADLMPGPEPRGRNSSAPGVKRQAERFGVWGGVLPRERAKRLQAEEQAAKEARREGVESEFVA